jgi:hypothetical protein
LQAKEFERAEALLLDAFQGLQKHFDRIPPNDRRVLASTRSRIVELYQAWDKPEQAEQWQAKSL